MTFVFQIAIPTFRLTGESDGWLGADHMPTFTVETSTSTLPEAQTEAEAKVKALTKHLPTGTTFSLVAI
jgi:hypothetical protein